MSLPAGYTARPPAWEDLDVVVELFKAWSVSRFGEPEPVRTEIERGWRSPGNDLERDHRIVLAPDGTAAAFASVHAEIGERGTDAHVRVHPDRTGQGLGAWALAWTEGRARDRAVEGTAPSVLWNATAAGDTAGRDLLRSHGYAFVRTFLHMARSLEDVDEPGPPPTGITIRTSRPGQDDLALHRASEEAFAQEFGRAPVSFEEFRLEWLGGPHYDPEQVFVAEADGEVVGDLFQTAIEDVGWISEVGVRPAWRGRGIAQALLRTSFADLARRGFRAVQLNVDAENPTGATRLYERVGMRVWREWHTYEKPLGADYAVLRPRERERG